MTSQAAAALVGAVREGGRAPTDVRSLEPLRPLIRELRRGVSAAAVEPRPLFVELGLVLQGEGAVEGRWAERVLAPRIRLCANELAA